MDNKNEQRKAEKCLQIVTIGRKVIKSLAFKETSKKLYGYINVLNPNPKDQESVLKYNL